VNPAQKILAICGNYDSVVYGRALSLAENLRGDGDYEVTDTGESAHNAVKTIAQEKPDCSVYL